MRARVPIRKYENIVNLNAARAKVGTSANLHYVCFAHHGTLTLLSHDRISYMCKKKENCENDEKEGVTKGGETNDICKHLEESSNYYVSLEFLLVVQLRNYLGMALYSTKQE